MNEVEQRLREIEERVSKATSGPWRACTWDPMEPPHVTLPLPAGAVCHRQYDLPRTREDAEFIAHAREDVPWLLSLLRAREEENHRLLQHIDELAEENKRLRELLSDARWLIDSYAPFLRPGKYDKLLDEMDAAIAVHYEAKEQKQGGGQPDHADVEWLMEENRRLRERVAELERIEAGVRRMIEELKPHV